MEILVTVEALDNEDWKIIQFLSGEENEVLEEANNIKNSWINQGWPKDQIRVSKSNFRKINHE